MIRTLRFQLIAIVVATVATVLATSQWLDTRLSEQVLEEDLTERALLVLDAASAHWARATQDELREELATLVEARPSLKAIDIFSLEGDGGHVLATTRPDGEAAEVHIGDDEVRELRSHGIVRTQISDAWGRIAVPLRREDRVVGAARVEIEDDAHLRLRGRLRAIDGVLFVSSIVGISLALGLFLQRRVARPVSQLVGGMRRAAGGELAARVHVAQGGEFGFLAAQLNQMLARIADLTAGLESRVARATRDLADRNRALREANEKLVQAQIDVGRSERLAALGHMAATIAHELGTPLNSVLGYTQLLMREQLSADQDEKLRIVESQVLRMIETIRSVLDRTRESRRVPVAIESLLSEAVDLASVRSAGRNVTIGSEVPAGLPAVPGDPTALRQVMLNLLTNAIDATRNEGRVTVRAEVLPPDDGNRRWIELAVEDFGPGMGAEEQRRVFEPFYTTKAPGRGSGLGLAIVDHIVRVHGGEILVESTPGVGTTMRVRLPLGV